MEIKLLEIRDSGTFIPAIAIKPVSRNEAERYLMSRAGYGPDTDGHAQYLLLARLDGGQMTYDAYSWLGGGSRTMTVAHDYIEKHWEELVSGDVVCVETILGLRSEKKKSERFSHE
jgi:hypothetical protein